mgnify:CR=1 FL=1
MLHVIQLHESTCFISTDDESEQEEQDHADNNVNTDNDNEVEEDQDSDQNSEDGYDTEDDQEEDQDDRPAIRPPRYDGDAGTGVCVVFLRLKHLTLTACELVDLF